MRILLVIAGVLFFVTDSKASTTVEVSYEEIEYEAIYNCRNKNWDDVDEKIIKTLIKVEKQYNVPPKLRGMLLAAACSESGYNPFAKGDWRKRTRRGKKVKVPMAIGLFQMWPWWERAYKIDRNSIEPAAHAFMKHIVRQLKRIKCKWRKPHRRWVAAWVTAIRSPSKNGRCNQKPAHLKILKKWHRSARDYRKNGCDSRPCGC